MYGPDVLTIAHTDLSGNSTATNDRTCSTQPMANYSASSDPPVVRTSSHGNSRNLTAVTPLSKECHHKRLYPSRAKKKREEVVNSAQGTAQRASAR
jgi:hypothetical protein